MSDARWRVGAKLGRTLYRDDRCVGMVDTPELAAEIVTAMNRWVGQPVVVVPNPNQNSLHCIACGTQLALRFWDRPGGPPGNGYACPKCHPV
jgi:hypothetical protein